eukprot:1697434-Karenia_brevis.AAC.1
MNEESRNQLRIACETCECRLQVGRVNGRNMYHLQSVAVSMHEVGKTWNVPSDGSRWMNLGGNRASSVCAGIVQLSWGMSREQ